jgi:hypothetical protein
VQSAELVLVCLTEKYLVASPNCYFECRSALNKEKRYLPILLESLPSKTVIETPESQVAEFLKDPKADKLKADWDKVQVWKKDMPEKVELLWDLYRVNYVYGVGASSVTVAGKDDKGDDKMEVEWSEEFVERLAEGIGNRLGLIVPFTKKTSPTRGPESIIPTTGDKTPPSLGQNPPSAELTPKNSSEPVSQGQDAAARDHPKPSKSADVVMLTPPAKPVKPPRSPMSRPSTVALQPPGSPVQTTKPTKPPRTHLSGYQIGT